MLFDTRLKVAGGLIAAVLSLLGAAQAHAAPSTALRYQCAPGQNLVVSRTDGRAVVRFIDKTYELRRSAPASALNIARRPLRSSSMDPRRFSLLRTAFSSARAGKLSKQLHLPKWLSRLPRGSGEATCTS
jgi:hypothetical protein